jgi:hypothetical protein
MPSTHSLNCYGKSVVVAKPDMSTTPNNPEDLLPCPFCEQPAIVHEVSLYSTATKSYYVAHPSSNDCLAQVGRTYCNCPWDGCTADFNSKADAIAAWNRRAKA